MTYRFAALLAAVNVGKRKVPMADLRDLLGALGYADVQTYLASGNAVFSASNDDADAHAARISQALAKRFGFDVPCLVRSGVYLRAVVEACPFPADQIAGKSLHAVFHSVPVAVERFADLDQAAFAPEEFRLGDRVLYLYLPEGIGRSPLAAALAKPAGRLKGVQATGRNWNTVKALVELTEGAG